MNNIKIGLAVFAAMAALSACGTVAAPRSGTSSPAASARAATAPAVATPAVVSPSAAVIASRLVKGGLSVTQLVVYTAVTDPNHLLGRQGGYTSKVAWVDPAAVAAGAGSPSSDPGGIEFGGGIEVFNTRALAAERLAYLKDFQPPFGDGYDYQAGTAILRLSNYLTPAQAAAYRIAFTTAAKGGTGS